MAEGAVFVHQLEEAPLLCNGAKPPTLKCHTATRGSLARSTLTLLLGLDGASYLTLVVGTKDKAIYTRSQDLV